MSGTRPDLSVVVVTHGGRELALRTLRSARAAAGAATIQWLVVDSGSGDDTAGAIAEEFADVRLFRRANIGFAAANNVALPHARGRYVLLLNPDVEVEQGTLAELVEELDRRPHTGAASVIQRAPDGTLQASIRRFPSVGRQLGEALFAGRLVGECESDEDGYRAEREADWLVGAFLVVRREALEAVGPLDERFFLYSEEKDWCYRIRRAGYDVRHLPIMTVTHHTDESPRPHLAAQLAYSKLVFARKHFGRLTRAGIRAGLVLRHLLRLALLGPAAAFRPRLRGRMRAERAAASMALGLAAPPFVPRDEIERELDAAD